MSDTPQGPGWWQASDDKWYPPPRPEMPGETATTAYPAAPPTAPMDAPPQVTQTAPYTSGPYAGPMTTPSPYGGMPAAPPPGGGSQNRTPLFVAIGALAALLLVLVVIVATSGDDDEAGPPTSQTDNPVTTRDINTTQPPTTSTDTTQPSTGGEVGAIQVVDKGWSTFNDAFGTPTGSYGFVIENTGEEIILGAELSVTVYDPDQGVVTTASGTIGSMQPGQQLGFGGDLYGDDVSNGVGDIAVDVGQSDFPPQVPTDGELTVTNVDWTGNDFGMSITFTVESTYSEQIDAPGASAVMRNEAGDIVGGASGSLTNFIPADGNTGGEVTSIENVPNVASIDVFVEPGGYYF